MIRATFFLCLSGVFLAGCDESSSQGQYESVMRLAQAPEATNEFLNKFSSIECKAKTKNLCTAKGCEEGPVSVTQRYDIRNRTYQRRGTKGIEKFGAEASPSGIWFNFKLPNATMLFRVNTLGDFKDVVTTNDLVVVYSGSCKFK